MLREIDLAPDADADVSASSSLSPIMRVYQALKEKYIFIERLAHAIALAHTGKQNLLLWGPGGHGKSTMVETALRALEVWDQTFVQSFDGGMDEARLWGGLDLAALDEQKVMQFNVARSFLPCRVAVFEEIFDAPRPVLLSLKDTLTRKWFMNGAQRVPMQTELVIACTNKDPREFSGDEEAYKAMLERFPLQLQVKWDKYDDGAYAKLFRKTLASDIRSRDQLIRVLANLMAGLSEPPFAVSPRVAVAAGQAVLANPATMGRRLLCAEDFRAILLIQGLENYTSKLEERIAKAVTTYGVPFVLQEVRNKLTALERKAQKTREPNEIVSLMSDASVLEARLAEIRSQPATVSEIEALEKRLKTFLTSGGK